jgi:hypothetical protein
MSDVGIHARITALLAATNASGPYPLSLVCTPQGLLVASAGHGLSDDDVAAFTCLFDDVLRRAVRDLGFHRVDEVTLLDPGRGRHVIRPLVLDGRVEFFLVVLADPKSAWRRNTTKLVADLERELAPLVEIRIAAERASELRELGVA